MLTMSVIPEQKKSVISYPKDFRIPSREINVYSKTDVKQKYEAEVREFIYSTLRSWVMSRKNAYDAMGQLSPQRAIAVDKILLMLVTHQNSRLHILCARIVQDFNFFTRLFPTKQSRNFHYFKIIIAEVLAWCEWYSIHYKEFNKNLIRTIN